MGDAPIAGGPNPRYSGVMRHLPPLPPPPEDPNDVRNRIARLRGARGRRNRYKSGDPRYWREQFRLMRDGGIQHNDVTPEEFWEAIDGGGSGTTSVPLRALWDRVQRNEARRPGVITMGPATRLIAASEVARELGVSERRAIDFSNSLGVNALDISGKWYIMVSDLEYAIWVNTRDPSVSDTSFEAFNKWLGQIGPTYAGLRRIAIERRLKEAAITDRPGKTVRRGRRRIRVPDSVAGLVLCDAAVNREVTEDGNSRN